MVLMDRRRTEEFCKSDIGLPWFRNDKGELQTRYPPGSNRGLRDAWNPDNKQDLLTGLCCWNSFSEGEMRGDLRLDKKHQDELKTKFAICFETTLQILDKLAQPQA